MTNPKNSWGVFRKVYPQHSLPPIWIFPGIAQLCQFCLVLFGILNIDDSKMMHQICYGFYWSIKNGQNWFFVYTLFWCNPMNYTPRFCQMKDLLKIYISVVSFISIAYVFVKLKIFKVSCIDSASMKWPLFVLFCFCFLFFGFYSPKYFSILLKFWPEVVQ